MQSSASKKSNDQQFALPPGESGYSVRSSMEPMRLATEQEQLAVKFIGNNSIDPVHEVPNRRKSISQRILQKSSTLLSSFSTKKSSKFTFANHSSDDVSQTGEGMKHTQTNSLPPYFFHTRRLTEKIETNSGTERLSVASVRRMLEDSDSAGRDWSACVHEQSSVGSDETFEPVDKVSKRGAGGDSHSRRPPAQNASWTHEESLAPNSKLTTLSTASVHQMPPADGPDESSMSVITQDMPQDENMKCRAIHKRFSGRHSGRHSDSNSGSFSSYSEGDLEMEDNALDNATGPCKTKMDSTALLVSFGDAPSSHELANVAALRIEEILTTKASVSDRKKWDNIQQFNKMNLVVGKHLGKGTFSDVFEVFTTVAVEAMVPTFESLGSDRMDLNTLIEAKFLKEGERKNKPLRFSIVLEDLNKEVDALFSSTLPGEAPQSIRKEPYQGEAEVISTECQPQRLTMTTRRQRHLDEEIDARFDSALPRGAAQSFREVRRPIRRPTDIGGSICMGEISRPSYQKQERNVVLAMKCLRPQIRSDAEHS
jgi:hypothetical protein